MSDDRIGQPMSLSQLILLVGKNAADTQLARGDITQDEYDERIKILFPDLELVKKSNGGMMNINDMTRPLSFAAGGPTPSEKEKNIIEKIKNFLTYKNKSGTEDLLMDFIMSEGMFAPSGKEGKR